MGKRQLTRALPNDGTVSEVPVTFSTSLRQNKKRDKACISDSRGTFETRYYGDVSA